MNTVELSTRDRILTSARGVAQARGYGGLSFRELAADVGIKAASVYHYFPSKAELGAALARRYWEDAAAALQWLSSQSSNPLEALSRYPGMFREALITDNRMCMCSFMAAEYDELPELVRTEVQTSPMSTSPGWPPPWRTLQSSPPATANHVAAQSMPRSPARNSSRGVVLTSRSTTR